MRALVCEAYGPIENSQDRRLGGARAEGGRDPDAGRRGRRELRRPAGRAGQAPEQARAALRAGQRDGGPRGEARPRREQPRGRPAHHHRRQPGRLCRICRGHRRERRGDPRDHALRPGDQLPDALSDGLRRAQMEGRHAAGRGAAGAWRGRRLGPDGHRGRQGDGRRRDRLGGRRREACGRPRSRRRSPDRLPHRGIARARAAN